MPDLKFRMLSPQDNIMEIQILYKPEAYLTLTWDNYFPKLSLKVPITINHENKTHHPMMHDYKRIYSTTESLAMAGCINSENNQNLVHW